MQTRHQPKSGEHGFPILRAAELSEISSKQRINQFGHDQNDLTLLMNLARNL